MPGLLPPGATLLFGPPKLGKTTLAMDLAWSVASGNDALGAAMTHQGDVLYVAAETTSADLVTLHEELFPDDVWPDRLSVLPLESFKDLGDQPLYPLFEGWAASVPAPSLLIVDTVQKVLWARQKINPTMRAQTQDYEALRHLQEWAASRSLSVLLIHHTNQRTLEKDEDWQNKAAGTSGLVAATDTNMMLARDGDTLLLKAQGRNLPEQEWYVSRHGRRMVLFDMVQASPRTGDRMKAVLSAVAACGGRATVSEVVEAAATMGRSADTPERDYLQPDTVRQYLRRAVKRGLLVQQERGVYEVPGHIEEGG